jgi:hypothetical protein
MSVSNGKVQEYVQVHHTASLGKKYLIQRGHISEVLQLEQELEPEQASVQEQEPELVPSLVQERVWVLERAQVRGQEPARVLVQVLEPAQGQVLEPIQVLVQVRVRVRGQGQGQGQGLVQEPVQVQELEPVQE